MPEKWVIDSWTLLQVTTAVHVPSCDTFYLHFSMMGGWSNASSIFIYVKIWTNLPASAQKRTQTKVGTTCEQCWWRKQSAVNVLLEAKQSTVLLPNAKINWQRDYPWAEFKVYEIWKRPRIWPKAWPPTRAWGRSNTRACQSLYVRLLNSCWTVEDKLSLDASPMFFLRMTNFK